MPSNNHAAFHALSAAAAVLTHTAGSPGTTWVVTDEGMSNTARADGRLARITLWHLQNKPAEAQAAEHAPEVPHAIDALLAQLNAIISEPDTRWYSEGLTRRDDKTPVIAIATFWRMTSAAARKFDMI